MTPMMPPQQQYMAPPPPPKKGMSGCMIAFIVVSIVGFVTAIVVGVVVYFIATSAPVKTAFKVVGESTKIAQKGLTAPGTAELRTLGCDQAMVIDMKEMGAVFSELIDGGFGDAGMAEGLDVTCSLNTTSKAIACDDVASTYVRAVGGTASAQFVVSVKRQNDSHELCHASYDADGKRVSSAGGI